MESAISTDSADPSATTPAATGEPVRGGRLVVGLEGETQDAWVPSAVQCAVSCGTVLRSVLEPLAVRNADGEIEPFLAESIEPTDDFTTWTITTRSGLTFHDGTPFDADAVVDNLLRQSASPTGGLRLLDVEKVDDVPAIVAIDDTTVEVTMSRPWSDFDAQLTTIIGIIGSPTWLAAADADPSIGAQPVGTGPFVFGSYTPGESYVGTRNEDYWRDGTDGEPLPYLDEVEFRPIDDGLARANALRSGDIDIAMVDDGETILDFRDDDSVSSLEQTAGGETFYLLLHSGQEDSPLNDRDVRCALVAATDTDQVSQVVALGALEVANGPFSPGQPGHLDDNGNAGYEPEVAAQLVADYEAENGPLSLTYTIANDSSARTQAQLVQQTWQDAGIDVEIREVDIGTMINDAIFGADEFEIISFRFHGGYALDEQYIGWHSSVAAPSGSPSFNFGRLRDPELDALLDANRQTDDPAEKEQIAQDANRRMAEQCWMVPTQWTTWALGSNPDLTGLEADITPAGSPMLVSQETPGVIPVASLWWEA